MLKKLLLPLIALLFITSCEQVTFDDLENEDANVVLQLSCYQRMPFATRSMQDVTELCSRINIVIFNGDTKLKTITQKSSDSNYGTIAMTLAEGTYKVVVIAHNGEGTATISSIEKVTFANNHITDTFYYYGDLNVTEERQTINLVLTRPVAAFRLAATTDLPASVKTLRFYYTGGSSTFSPLTGFGCVNSRQTETREVSAGQREWDVFTFPHANEGLLKMTITALDTAGNTLAERVLEDVPVTIDEVTRYSGDLFVGSSGAVSSPTLSIKAEGDWKAVRDYDF